MNLQNIKNIINKTPKPILVIRSDSTIVSCNTLFLDILDLKESEVENNKLSVIFSNEIIANNFMSHVLQTSDRKKTVKIKTKLLAKDRFEIPVDCNVSFFYQSYGDQATYLIITHFFFGFGDLSVNPVPEFFEEIPFPVLRISREGIILNCNKDSWIILSFWDKGVGQTVPSDFMELMNKSIQYQINNEFEIQIGFKVFVFAVVPGSFTEYVDLFGYDITQRKQIEKQIQINAQVFESAYEGIMIADTDYRIIDVNNAFCDITGYDREEILGEDMSILRSERNDDEFYRELWETVNNKGSWQGEIWDRRKNGDEYPKWLTMSSVHNEEGKVVRYVGLFSDITVIKQTQEKLFNIANYDALTGLVNRRYFQDHLEKSLQQAKRTNDLLALMFIDLDGFKFINDTYGHQAGDQTLRIVAERLKKCVRDADVVSRMGGDEFTILLPNIKDSQNIIEIADKILKIIGEPLKQANGEYFVTTSIGIAIFPNDASDGEELVQNADTALYKSKELGKNIYQFFSPEMNLYVKERLSIKTQIRHALENNEFKVFYQPQYDLLEKCITGIEALVRLETMENIIIGPDDFIAVAEETGQINEIGAIVLQSACEQGKKWLDENILHVPISVNISAIQLRHPGFIKKISSIIETSGFPPNLLEFELTETILLDNVGEIQNKLNHLKLLGCSLAIDDFGTKYSSLYYLKIFPINKLKIDKSFLIGLPQDDIGADIVKTIIAMGRSLKLKIVAEGVETIEQVDFLINNGCTVVQGYYFCKPVPANEMMTMLINNNQSIKRE